MNAAIVYTWDGEAMQALPRFAKVADKQFVVGEQYRMEAVEERSLISHRHYFAQLHEDWLNLPEDISEDFPTQEHLRKWALIKTGYADKQSIVCSSKEEAMKVAAFIEPMDVYAVVTVEGCVVTKYNAQSQSVKAMGKEKFQKSKSDVLDYVSAMIGVSKEQLSSRAVES